MVGLKASQAEPQTVGPNHPEGWFGIPPNTGTPIISGPPLSEDRPPNTKICMMRVTGHWKGPLVLVTVTGRYWPPSTGSYRP